MGVGLAAPASFPLNRRSVAAIDAAAVKAGDGPDLAARIPTARAAGMSLPETARLLGFSFAKLHTLVYHPEKYSGSGRAPEPYRRGDAVSPTRPLADCDARWAALMAGQRFQSVHVPQRAFVDLAPASDAAREIER